MYAVISASDYKGSSLRTYTSVKSAELIRDYFIKRLPYSKIVIKETYDSTKSAFVDNLRELSRIMSETPTVGVTVFCGHGNNVYDHSGDEQDRLDELYQFTDGILLDDEFTQIFENVHPESLLITLSDCCSSGSAVDETLVAKGPFKGRWISIGSSTDTEDSLQSGEGGILATTIASLTESELLDSTLKDLFNLMSKKVSNSWAGYLQHITMRVSHGELWKMTLRGLVK